MRSHLAEAQQRLSRSPPPSRHEGRSRETTRWRPNMRVFVAGATGAIGQRLVPRLLERDHSVVATTRTPDKAPELLAMGAEPIVVDGLDAAGIGRAVARAEPDAIVHQMTALAGKADLRRFDRWFARTNALRTRGTENLLAAAQATGVPRVVA